jgi:ATP-binding cassette, subfamily B, bacterial MsbA
MEDLKRLLRYVRPHRRIFVLAVIAMILTAVFETAIGALLIPIVDQFIPAPAGSATLFWLHSLIPREPWFQAWLTISGLLVFFTFSKGISGYFSAYLMAKIGQAVVLDLRRELYDHLLRQPISFFERHRSNYLVSRLVVSCSAIEMAVSAHLRDVLREGFMLVFFLGAALYINWRLMIGALIIAPIIAFLTTRFSRALRRLAEITFEGNKLLTDTAQEALSNQAIVKAYQAETRESKRFSKVAEMIAKASLRSGRIAAISPPTIELIGALAIAVLLYFGLREINLGNMEAAQFFAFIYFLLKSYDPMRKISRQHNEISRAFAAAKDVWDVLDEDEILPEKSDAIELEPLKDHIELKNVSFHYGDNGDMGVLIDVSLKIPKGSMVALVGESGAGKSSLIKLIQRLYDPTSGAIFWDGTDLRDARLSSLKNQISLVTQETVLFNDSVRYNISYGNPDASDEDVIRAAKIALADEFVDRLPEKYDSPVGERGGSLSGGQRQRIAIARAVLADAPVLILDEATSALDTESERLVQAALSNLMQNRTSIVIAHRLSTVRKADMIAVMDQGKIVETGTHEELLEKNGKYRKLYELQFATKEPEEPV